MLPGWLPDETVFSLVSRYHQLSGNRLASQTCRELFGHAQQGAQHDFPVRLTHFACTTGGVLGDARTIIHRHTILPFYLHFVGPDMVEGAFRSLEGEVIGGLKFRLGLVNSRLRANHPLKACPECMQHDHDTFGTPYWHREHQYPGVWICPNHRTPLLSSTFKTLGAERFLWQLPHTGQLSTVFTTSSQPGARVIDALSGFAQASLSLAALPFDIHIRPEVLQFVFMSELQQRDLATCANRLHISRICSSYLDATSPLGCVSELIPLCGCDQQIGSTLAKLLRVQKNGTHPLRYLGLIYWLFGSWPRFMEKVRAHADSVSQKTALEQQRAHKATPQARRDFLACLKRGGSVIHCATSFDLDYDTCLEWASQAGKPISRRAKSVVNKTYEAIANDLRTGQNKVAIAALHRVSLSTVSFVLASVSGVREEWRAAKFAAMRDKARSAWSTAVATNVGAGVTALKKQHPGTFEWLHRNDRAWLAQSRKLIPRAKAQTRSDRADWEARDRALESRVGEAIAFLKATSSDPQRPVRLRDIYQLVTELKAKRGVLKNFPKTREAIHGATKNLAPRER